MSNALAIAAVTATLRHRLDLGLNAAVPGTRVTTCPLDKAGRDGGNQVNVFLYQTAPNAAWRNVDVPDPTQSGGPGRPPLALNLYYLISAFGQDDDDPEPNSHRLLGRAMQLLHDRPILAPDEIRGAMPEGDLHAQAERVRITLQPLGLEEMTKLWTTFQAPYRISVAYEVSVVLIESTGPG